MYPYKFTNRQPLNLRLGIKSSFSKIRNAIAVAYCCFVANEKKFHCIYSKQVNDTITIDDSLKRDIESYLEINDISEYIENSPLFLAQLEHIQVAFELLFGLGRVSFVNNTTNNSIERKGGKRYQKQIFFSSQMRLFDIIISSHSKKEQIDFLIAWLNNSQSAIEKLDNSVCELLTILSERCIFKLKFKDKEDLFFQQEGIIKALLDSEDNKVALSSEEVVGTLRVFNSFVSENLHSFLTKSTDGYSLKTENTTAQEYLQEQSTKLDLLETRILNNTSFNQTSIEQDEIETSLSSTVSFDKNLLTAMRTKPFLLLAGISGTGKSRIVKQMAFECCPETEALRTDKTSPGNYQLIEVKPNWHDSTEVLGYESEIGGKHYVVTPFVKFLVKAMCYEDKAPFFVCMDEMNLAPVEQYFAEFLSVLESRKLVDGKITSEPLIKADIFKKYGNGLKVTLFDLQKAEDNIYGTATSDEAADYGSYNEVYDRLMTEGLRLPSNLIVVGTVNMDETTHQFSRKVIDRAMTIEMNIDDEETPFIDFFGKSGDLSYPQEVQPKELFLPTVVQANEAMAQLPEDDSTHLQDNIPTMLLNLNKALNGTPFKIAYRVQNELVLYYHALRKEQPDITAEDLLAKAMEAILMLKVLPRIEGDEDLLEKPLDKLAEFVAPYPEASKKVAEMQARLKQAHFASFWP